MDWLTGTDGFVPRKNCGAWEDWEVALHVVSDVLIWLAYLSIPLVLVYFARQRRGLPFTGLFVLFAVFILACGTNHLVEAVIFYHPVYHLSGVVKAVTAAVSWLTVLALVPAVPRLLDLTAAAAARHEAVPTAPPARPRWQGYAVAAAAAALSLGAREALGPLLGTKYPYLISFLAVIYTAWEAGFGPAVLCTVLTGVGTEAWIIAPDGSVLGATLADRLAFGLFLFSGLGTGVLGEAQRRARERAEAALDAARETADRLALSLDAARLGDWNWNAADDTLALSPRAAAVFGFDPTAPVTWAAVRKRIHPADRDRADAAVRAAVLERTAFDIECRVVRPDGEAWLSARGRAAYDAAGSPRGMYGVVADVTPRKRVEDDLRRSEERYKAFVAQSSEGIWRFELDEPVPTTLPVAEQLAAYHARGYLAECNDAFARMYGYTWAVELTGARLADFFDAADPRTTAFLTAFVSGGHRLTDAESRERDRYGNPRVFLNTLVGIVEGGSVIRAWGTQRDVTDRTHAEELLRAGEERYRLATEAVRGLVYDADMTAGRVERSAGLLDLVGVRPEAADPVVGWWPARIHPDDLPGVLADRERGYARGAPTLQAEYRVRHADGRWVWVEDRARVMYGDDGKPRRAVGCRSDVTERKEGEARLRENEARFRTLAEAVPVAVWVCRPDGWCEYMNARWEEITGVGLDGSLGAGWLDQVHPDDRPRAAAAWNAAVVDPAVGYRIEYRLQSRGGGYRWVLAAGFPHRAAGGAVVRWFGTCTDIDDKKRHAETLERLVAERTAELVRSNKELEEFAFAASHDLQEPLRKIQTYGARLKEKARDQLADDNRERLDRMMASAGRMGRLIDDLLAYSRVTTRAKAFAAVDLNAALADALDDLAARLELTGGGVEAGPLPTVSGDAGQLRQVFQNLVGNALKFHRPGVPPVVRVSAERTAAGWAVTVADNGIGFEDRFAGRIFQVFQRLHGREEYEGTGVGLAVCKKIVDRHGGAIAAHGRPGEGATFVVTLPERS
ncbi:PAS domain-containing protein [Urbifossiella limnaea]|uniref:histidine kinase n=1 Tax=Urbifossiella limnaea TaxID=2528023 RepID=A0A517Y0Q2_9BACT|nr:PAS domain-containing protein [Urbifossiella limnaea]QDU23342.1 Phytochrome-like protein cph1 [Urbifossiella limnaea]